MIMNLSRNACIALLLCTMNCFAIELSQQQMIKSEHKEQKNRIYLLTAQRKRLSIGKTLLKIGLLLYCVNDVHNFYKGACHDGMMNALSIDGFSNGLSNTNTAALYNFVCTMFYFTRGIYRGGYYVLYGLTKLVAVGEKAIELCSFW